MPKDCDHDSYAVYKHLIGPLRAKARELGYALAVHGTLRRDIDLVAVPWAADAAEARVLAESLRDVAREYNGGVAHMKPAEADNPWLQAGCPTAKPYGRLVWSYHLGGGPYIDLSVVPKQFSGNWLCEGCQTLNTQARCWHCGADRVAPPPV